MIPDIIVELTPII